MHIIISNRDGLTVSVYFMAVAELGMGDMGSCLRRHLARDGTGHPYKLFFAVHLFFYCSFACHVNDIMSHCGSMNLVRGDALILVCEQGRLLREMGRGAGVG